MNLIGFNQSFRGRELHSSHRLFPFAEAKVWCQAGTIRDVKTQQEGERERERFHFSSFLIIIPS